MRKTMEINRHKLSRVRKILGTKTDTAAVDAALSMVIGNQEIDKAIENLFGALPKLKSKVK